MALVTESNDPEEIVELIKQNEKLFEFEKSINFGDEGGLLNQNGSAFDSMVYKSGGVTSGDPHTTDSEKEFFVLDGFIMIPGILDGSFASVLPKNYKDVWRDVVIPVSQIDFVRKIIRGGKGIKRQDYTPYFTDEKLLSKSESQESTISTNFCRIYQTNYTFGNTTTKMYLKKFVLDDQQKATLIAKPDKFLTDELVLLNEDKKYFPICDLKETIIPAIYGYIGFNEIKREKMIVRFKPITMNIENGYGASPLNHFYDSIQKFRRSSYSSMDAENVIHFQKNLNRMLYDIASCWIILKYYEILGYFDIRTDNEIKLDDLYATKGNYRVNMSVLLNTTQEGEKLKFDKFLTTSKKGTDFIPSDVLIQQKGNHIKPEDALPRQVRRDIRKILWSNLQRYLIKKLKTPEGRSDFIAMTNVSLNDLDEILVMLNDPKLDWTKRSSYYVYKDKFGKEQQYDHSGRRNTIILVYLLPKLEKFVRDLQAQSELDADPYSMYLKRERDALEMYSIIAGTGESYDTNNFVGVYTEIFREYRLHYIQHQNTEISIPKEISEKFPLRLLLWSKEKLENSFVHNKNELLKEPNERRKLEEFDHLFYEYINLRMITRFKENTKEGIFGLNLEVDKDKSGFGSGSKDLADIDINIVKQSYPIPLSANWRLVFSGRVSAYTLVHDWDGNIGFMPNNVKIFTKIKNRKYTTGAEYLQLNE